MSRSIHTRLLAGTLAASVVVLASAGGVVYWLTRARLLAEFDAGLATRARSIAALVEEDREGFEIEAEGPALTEYSRAERPEYFQIWHPDGRVLARSESLGEGGLERPPGVEARGLVLPDGRRGRSVALSWPVRRERSGPPTMATIAVACETASMDGMLARLGQLLVAVGVVTSGLLAAIMSWVVRRGLAPLGSLAARIDSIGEADLSARIDLPGCPRELGVVVERTNEMLGRLEAAVAREKGFTADAAHELRTPLSGLRATLEVALSRPRESAEYRRAMDECLAIARQMQTMVGNLLDLARLDAAPAGLDLRRVAVADLLAESWKPLEQRARQRGLRIAEPQANGVCVHTDREKLQQVLCNLLDNAVSYADEGGVIEAMVGQAAERVSITIRNSGSTVPPGLAARVFDRFWRGDAARHDTGLHCGLGLALCRRLVEVLGGTISVGCESGGWFEVRVELPAAAPAGRGESDYTAQDSNLKPSVP